MTSFDYCEDCNFPRYIEGLNKPADYIREGWVQIKKIEIDKHGVRKGEISYWRCPMCDELRQARHKVTVRSPEDTANGPFGSYRRGD